MATDCPRCCEPLDTEDECWGCGWPDVATPVATVWDPVLVIGRDAYGREVVL
jgi:hypothetical protein